MNGRTEFLLDTNAVIALLRGDAGILAALGKDSVLAISIMTVLEFRCFADLAEHDSELFRAFTRSVRVIDLCGADAGLIDAAIHLRRSHRLKLPDAVIVASAQVNSMTLVRQDEQLLRLAGTAAMTSF